MKALRTWICMFHLVKVLPLQIRMIAFGSQVNRRTKMRGLSSVAYTATPVASVMNRLVLLQAFGDIRD